MSHIEGLQVNTFHKRVRKVPNMQKLLNMLFNEEPKDRPDFEFTCAALRKIKQQWITILKRRLSQTNP